MSNSKRASEPLGLKLQGLAWLAGWQLSRILPERLVVRTFELLSARNFRRNAKRREIVRANLAAVVPAGELDAAVRDAFRWYGRYWAETFRIPDIPQDAFDRRFSVEGAEHIEAASASGNGGVLATLHQGNWDAGGRWVAKQWGLTAVAEVLRPRAVFERFVAHRIRLGIRIIPLEKGGDATGRCLKELNEGRLVALVADRDLTGRGVEVEMFGRRTRMPRGPAFLALESGAPLIPATIIQHEDGSWRALVMPPLETRGKATAPEAVAALTQKLAEAFEHLISVAPAQWHMFSRYWTDA